MDKYAQLKRFHHERRLQVYIYDFMYVDTKTMPVDELFIASKKFVENYKKMSTIGLVPKNWIGFSHILLEDYELDNNLYEKKIKNQTTHPTIKSNDLAKILLSYRKNGFPIQI